MLSEMFPLILDSNSDLWIKITALEKTIGKEYPFSSLYYS
jgi:hypothetical protein